MRSFELIVFLGKYDGSSQTGFPFKIFSINGGLGEIRLEVVQLAQMSAAVALRAQTSLPAMIREVGLSQFGHGLVEVVVEALLCVWDELIAATGVEILCGLVEGLAEFSTLVETCFHVGQSSDSGA